MCPFLVYADPKSLSFAFSQIPNWNIGRKHSNGTMELASEQSSLLLQATSFHQITRLEHHLLIRFCQMQDTSISFSFFQFLFQSIKLLGVVSSEDMVVSKRWRIRYVIEFCGVLYKIKFRLLKLWQQQKMRVVSTVFICIIDKTGQGAARVIIHCQFSQFFFVSSPMKRQLETGWTTNFLKASVFVGTRYTMSIIFQTTKPLNLRKLLRWFQDWRKFLFRSVLIYL